MNGNHVRLVLSKEREGVLAKRMEQRERGRVVVIERKPLCPSLEALGRILTLRAKVINAIVLGVACDEKPLHVLDVVPIHALAPRRREPHCDNSRRDVGQIKIETVLNKSHLVLRHHVLQHVCEF
eukprot:Amastigsp_a178648_84.p5 type:complete len:125 gc:universal Amastigsp_a178648_84:400-26(-)